MFFSSSLQAVGATSFVAGKVGIATMALGRYLAPHVHAKGSTLLSKTMGYGEDEAKDKMGGVLTVAAGAVEGFGTIYDGLEKSAGILGSNLSQNSVKIIEHKYGTTAGELAGDTFDTVGNLINLNKNVKGLITPKSLVKRTVKGAGKGIIGDFRPNTMREYFCVAEIASRYLTAMITKPGNQPNLLFVDKQLALGLFN